MQAARDYDDDDGAGCGGGGGVRSCCSRAAQRAMTRFVTAS